MGGLVSLDPPIIHGGHLATFENVARSSTKGICGKHGRVHGSFGVQVTLPCSPMSFPNYFLRWFKYVSLGCLHAWYAQYFSSTLPTKFSFRCMPRRHRRHHPKNQKPVHPFRLRGASTGPYADACVAVIVYSLPQKNE